MRAFFATLLTLGAVLSFTKADTQIKTLGFDPDLFQKKNYEKGVTYEPANQREHFAHGTLMALDLKDKSKAVGTLVRSDVKNKKLILRLQSEAAPVAYNFADIENATRGFAKPKASADGILPAADTATPIVEPEIQKVVIINGNVRTVRYNSTVVSRGEKEVLEALEKAENDLAQAESDSAQRQSAVDMQITQQRLTMDYQQQINKTVYLYNRSNFPNQPLTFADFDLRQFAPAPLVSLNQLTQIVPPAPITTAIPAPNPEALAKARDNYERIMKNNTVFENDRLVAVIADGNAK